LGEQNKKCLKFEGLKTYLNHHFIHKSLSFFNFNFSVVHKFLLGIMRLLSEHGVACKSIPDLTHPYTSSSLVSTPINFSQSASVKLDEKNFLLWKQVQQVEAAIKGH